MDRQIDRLYFERLLVSKDRGVGAELLPWRVGKPSRPVRDVKPDYRFCPAERLQPLSGFLNLVEMVVTKTLRAASGWLELGLADEALYELQALPPEVQLQPESLELKLAAQMECEQWNLASETARLLCLKAEDVPEFFLRAAYCLHETGDTLAACNQLLRGPKTLFEMAIFHYNLACYLWTLGEGPRAKGHLKQAIDLDETFLAEARTDRDLAGMELP